MRDHHLNVTMDTCDRLDHGTSVPLFYLAEHKPDIKIVPITYSKQDLKAHFQFGQSLKEVLQESNKRVAIIASGDLSHRLSTDSPAGFSKHGEVFDNAVKDGIINKNATALMNIDQQVIDGAGECGLKSLLILMGVLHGIKYDPQIMDYNDSLGVGYLTCNFQLP
jgi:AmmeMemoRadiSam system protein B